jgi:hypothetical protein
MKRLILVAFCASALTACHDFRDDLIIICDAPDKIKDRVAENAKAKDKLQAMGEYMWENVKTKDGQALVDFLATADRAQRSKVLRDQAMQYNVVSCHMADLQ